MTRSNAPLRSDAVLERLKGLHPKLIDLSLGRIERLLDALGNPHRRLAPVVHVAGTNGKGSAVAFLKAIVEAAGLAAHVYTSPHLVRFAERILVGGGMLDDAALTALLEECEAANAGRPITFFEITTAAAFVAFARAKADVVLLEVGLGGRFDATNVVDRPALSVITPVSMDHMHFLGDTLDRIAFEKAGILKPGVPAVIGPQEASAEAVIEARAREVGATLIRFGAEWSAAMDDGALVVTEGAERLALPSPSLAGPHQAANAGTAVVAARRLGLGATGLGAIDRAAIAGGIAGAIWPARLQPLDGGTLARRLPPGWSLVLDGGHNRSAAEALAAVARRWADRPLWLVMGALDTRDPRLFIEPLAPYIAGLRAVPIPGEDAALPPAAIVAAARECGVAAEAATDIGPALDAIAAAAQAAGQESGRVLICGSLYLAGRVLDLNGTPPAFAPLTSSGGHRRA